MRIQNRGPKPTGLPAPVKEVKKDSSKGARVCPKCNQECRIVSNELGVSAHCNHCKEFWPISGALNPPNKIPLVGPRPMVKQTMVEPDWERAFDDIEEYEHEATRRKEWEKG